MQPLRVARLSQGVVEGVLSAIRSGEYEPGERLPSERRLADELGVSRTSVREGLRVLELMGAIEVRQGRGAVILGEASHPSGELLRRWLDSHRDEVVELLEVREALEAAAAAQAATARNGRIALRQAGSDELDAAVRSDLEFHSEVALMSGNSVLARLVHELNGVLEPSRYAMFALPGRKERSHYDHVQIADAINRGDARRAASAMRRHIVDTRKEIELHTSKGTA